MTVGAGLLSESSRSAGLLFRHGRNINLAAAFSRDLKEARERGFNLTALFQQASSVSFLGKLSPGLTLPQRDKAILLINRGKKKRLVCMPVMILSCAVVPSALIMLPVSPMNRVSQLSLISRKLNLIRLHHVICSA